MTYCEKRHSGAKWDKRSYRLVKKPNGTKLLFACPVGSWQPRKERCKGGIRLYKSLKRITHGRCPRGAQRITKAS